jgi:hypothetical protein
VEVESTTTYRGITLQQALGLVSITLEDGYTLDLGRDASSGSFIITESHPENGYRVITVKEEPGLFKELFALAEATKNHAISEAVWIVYANGGESLRITGDKENPPVITTTIARDREGATKQGFSIATGMQNDDELPAYLNLCGVMFSTPNRLINDTDAQFGFTYGLMSLAMDCIGIRRQNWERM